MEKNIIYFKCLVEIKMKLSMLIIGGFMVKKKKHLPVNAGNVRDAGSIPGSGRSLEKAWQTTSSILVWGIPWTEKRGGLQSRELQRVIDN